MQVDKIGKRLGGDAAHRITLEHARHHLPGGRAKCYVAHLIRASPCAMSSANSCRTGSDTRSNARSFPSSGLQRAHDLHFRTRLYSYNSGPDPEPKMD